MYAIETAYRDDALAVLMFLACAAWAIGATVLLGWALYGRR